MSSFPFKRWITLYGFMTWVDYKAYDELRLELLCNLAIKAREIEAQMCLKSSTKPFIIGHNLTAVELA